MTKLSIIIVNYNVRYFLEQCLNSVYRSVFSYPFEVFVVDNHSQDDSLAMLKEKFPQVKVIANTENAGFSKANNQAMKQAQGQYFLLLNPDTVIQEDTLQKCIDFLDKHEDAGGLGVKMYDGAGEFLPESKRGFPSPMAAFAKMSGLAKLFPQSKLFGQYHLTYLDKDKTAEVDVLSGACMFLRKSVTDLIGYLDEDYFMYGEDIDMSYRIQQAWFKNYYFAETSIIHFKGESTKKGSLNYVRVFYNAMIIFAKKHITGPRGKLLTLLLTVAIYFRALLAIFQNFFGKIGVAIADAAIIFGNLYFLQWFWQKYVRAADGIHFPGTFMYVNIPLYILIWVMAMWATGVYAKHAKWPRLIAGISVGTFLIATMYAFFPNSLRTSRGIIVFGFLMNTGVLLLFRWLLSGLLNSYRNYFVSKKKYIVVSDADEAAYISQRLSGAKQQYLGYVRVNGAANHKSLGHVEQLRDIVEAYEPDEILFSTDKLSMQFIIQTMTAIKQPVEFKMVSKSHSAIGSASKNTSGEIYTFDVDLPSKKSFLEKVKGWF